MRKVQNLTEEEKRRIGRPLEGKPKNRQTTVRYTEDEAEILDEYEKQEKVSRTTAIRHGIHELKNKIK